MSKCKTKKCGCLDTGLTTPTPCAHDTPECPNPDPCSETFSDCCIVHNGDGIAELNIQTGDRVCDIWQKIALAIAASGGGGGPVAPTDIPNDPWVSLTEADMTLITPASAAINSVTSLDLAYKIISTDTVILKGYLRVEITVTALTDSVNLNFRWPAFSGSNWFVGTKTLQGILERVPISIVNVTGGLGVDAPNQQGNAIGSTLAGLNLVAIGQTNLQLPNGNYTIDIYFELTSPLQ